jgi:hypothetical protein
LQTRRTKAEEEARETVMEVDNGMNAEVPGEDMVDVDADDGGDEGRNKGDDNEYALEDLGGVEDVEHLIAR